MNEKEITTAIREILNAYKIFHWKQWQGLGSPPGVSDILGIFRGKPLAIEVKTAKGRLSGAQDRFLQNFREAGGIGILARSVEDVIRTLDLPVLL